MKKYTSVLIGCGDIATSLAAQLDDHRCLGLRRNPAQLPAGIEGIAADFTNAEALRDGLKGIDVDYAVLTFTPPAFNEQAYRTSYLAGARACVEAMSVKRRLFFVSSSSVYGENAGSWIDESSPCEASGFSGQVMREAEELLLSSSLPSCIVRFSGIYGPGRQRLINRVSNGEFSKRVMYTNRIHRDDCAGVLAHLIAMDAADEDLQDVYLASDCLPVLNTEVEAWLAEQLGQVAPATETDASVAGKRCNNQRLLDSGYTFIHRDYRSGYAAMLGAE